MATTLVPSGPRGNRFTGVLSELRRDPLTFFTRCARDYGDFVPFRVGPTRHFLLNHPDLLETVLVTNHRNFIKSQALQRSRVVLGNGLLTSEGNLWLRQRRLVQPAFHRDRVEGYGRIMAELAERALGQWGDGETRDIHAEMMHLTLAVVARSLFGAEISGAAGEVGEAMEVVLDDFNSRASAIIVIPEWIPTRANRQLQKATRQLDGIIYGIIERRRSSGEEADDLLAMLLQARDEDGEPMADRQLRDEVMTLFLAGHETTAITLSWTFYLLAQHPEVESKMVSEFQEVLAGRTPAVADLPRLKYTEMVIQESMRLYPPAWAIGRQALADCEIGGHQVPAGSILLMSQWVMHRDPRFFESPEQFAPDRWSGDLDRRLPKFAYFPFGGGPRHCIGYSFAQMEAALVLAAVMQRYHLELVPGHRATPHPSITLRPGGGVRMVLHKR